MNKFTIIRLCSKWDIVRANARATVNLLNLDFNRLNSALILTRFVNRRERVVASTQKHKSFRKSRSEFRKSIILLMLHNHSK